MNKIEKYKIRWNDLILKMVGKKFDKLTVLEFVNIRNGNSHWRCICDCGNESEVSRPSLVNGNTTSCGCKRVYNGKQGESGLKRLYTQYKVNAKTKNREFNLTISEFKEITSKNCKYCGVSPEAEITIRINKNIKIMEYAKYRYNGIDRVNSNFGYIKENIVPCCKWCNIAKIDKTVDDFKMHINKIYTFSNLQFFGNKNA